MGKLELTIPLPPSVNNYQEYRVRRLGKKNIVETYPSEETEAFYHQTLRYIEGEIKEQGWITPLHDKYILVEATMYLRRAGSDCDNYWKCTLDALEKTDVVINDTQIVPRVINVFIDKDSPRVELTVTIMDKVGIFDNEEEMEEFKKNNCDKCTRRNKTHCTVFKGFLEARVHDLDNHKNCKHLKPYKE